MSSGATCGQRGVAGGLGEGRDVDIQAQHDVLTTQIEILDAAIAPLAEQMGALRLQRDTLSRQRGKLAWHLWQEAHNLHTGDKLAITAEFLVEARARVRRNSWEPRHVDGYIRAGYCTVYEMDNAPTDSLTITHPETGFQSSIELGMALRMRAAWIG